MGRGWRILWPRLAQPRTPSHRTAARLTEAAEARDCGCTQPPSSEPGLRPVPCPVAGLALPGPASHIYSNSQMPPRGLPPPAATNGNWRKESGLCMSQARPVLCLRRAGAGARLTQTLLHFSNAKSRQCRLLLVASLSLSLLPICPQTWLLLLLQRPYNL